MPFLKPQKVNDWGYNSYWTKVKKSTAGTISASDQDPKHRLNVGQIVEVQWPDGHIDEYKIVAQTAFTIVERMDVITHELFVEEKVRGVKVLVPLEKILVWR